jgi:hypothetical protein
MDVKALATKSTVGVVMQKKAQAQQAVVTSIILEGAKQSTDAVRQVRAGSTISVVA